MLYLVAILGAIWALVIVVYQVRIISRNKKIRLINFVNLMFAFVYGLLPAVVLTRAALGIGGGGLDTSAAGAVKLLIALLMSVFVHFWLNLAYRGTKVKKKPAITKDSTAFFAGFVMLIVGFLALLLWTKAAGGVFEFIKIAPGIRAGYEKLPNPFGFLQHVSQILMLAACILTAYWLQHKWKIWIVLPAGLALYGAVLFIMAWDSRAAFGFLLLMITLVVVERSVEQGRGQIKRVLLFVGVIAAAAIVLMVQSEGMTQEFRGNEFEKETSSNLFVIMESEFGYIFGTQQKVLGSLMEPDLEYQLGNDFINAVFSWVPTRFIPFELPETLWNYNTRVIMSHNTYGTIPADFVSACLLELGVLGLLVIPLAMGWLLKKADGMLESETYNFYRSCVKAALAMMVVNRVSHFQLATLPLSVFYIVVGHMIVWFCRTLANGGRSQVGGTIRQQ